MSFTRPIAAICFLAMTGSASAAPLVLYDPGSAAPVAPGSDLKSMTTTGAASQPCGLTTPCTDLNTSAHTGFGTSLGAPFGGDVEYGMSGEASAGVSNHGQGGSVGVLAWMKAGDTTLALGLSYSVSKWNGRGYYPAPVQRP